MNKLILIAPLLVLLLVVVPSTHAYVKFSVPKTLKAGSIISINGTSIPSNSTHTNCDVQLDVNGLGYQKVTPIAKDGTYTVWKYTGNANSPSIHIGENKITAKYECFPPDITNSTMPNFIHHHTTNVTGVP